ncbi:MAG: M1 family metallopeptidase, partial [Polyangia bacterium]
MSPSRSGAAAVVSVVAVCTVSWIAVGQKAPKFLPEQKRVGSGEMRPAIAGPPVGAAEIPFVSAHAAAVTTPSAPDAWGGPRTGKEATLSDRVVDYAIEATLDPKAHTVDGKEKMVWRNRSDRAVKSIYLHLYLNAFEGPGSTFFTERRENRFEFRSDVPIKKGEWGHIELKKVQQGGKDVPWSFVHPDGGPASDHTVVRLDLPAEVAPGASATVDLDFHDQLPRVIARTGWWGSFHMVAQWFPKVGVLELAGERGATAPRWNVHEFHLHSEFYADWAGYDVKMTVPKNFQVASAGEEEGAPVDNGGLTTHHFTQGDVHDFAWMAVDNFAPPLAGSYEGAGSPKVTVKVFYPREYEASAAPALKAGIDSIKFFSETLGPYPYPTSTIIVPPYNAGEAGGMEYQTIYTAEGFDTVEPDTLASAALDFVTIHEFGHGYFYGLLASNEFEEPLLDEGLNEYWDMRMMRARNQDVHLTTPFLKLLGIDPTMSGFQFERAGGALDAHPSDPIGANAWDRLSSESYGQVYSRTATVMHDLEERLGHEATERGFKLYYQRWHFRHPSTADLREALAEGSGDRHTVEQVFEQNVYGVAVIDDLVQNLTSEEQKPEPGTTFKDG